VAGRRRPGAATLGGGPARVVVALCSAAALTRRGTDEVPCGCSSMAEHQLPKLNTRVRFPSSAPLVTDRTLQRRCRSGVWQRVFHGVDATTFGPLIRPALLTAALLYGGPNAMLSHRTAGEEWRMLAPDTSMPVHITLPYGMSAVSQLAVPGQCGVLHQGLWCSTPARINTSRCRPSRRPPRAQTRCSTWPLRNPLRNTPGGPRRESHRPRSRW